MDPRRVTFQRPCEPAQDENPPSATAPADTGGRKMSIKGTGRRRSVVMTLPPVHALPADAARLSKLHPSDSCQCDYAEPRRRGAYGLEIRGGFLVAGDDVPVARDPLLDAYAALLSFQNMMENLTAKQFLTSRRKGDSDPRCAGRCTLCPHFLAADRCWHPRVQIAQLSHSLD